jgi:hypothetical protein
MNSDIPYVRITPDTTVAHFGRRAESEGFHDLANRLLDMAA